MMAVALIIVGTAFAYVGWASASDVILVMGILAFFVGLIWAALLLVDQARARRR
jgi:hypothetical protein